LIHSVGRKALDIRGIGKAKLAELQDKGVRVFACFIWNSLKDKPRNMRGRGTQSTNTMKQKLHAFHSDPNVRRFISFGTWCR
jgi:NAD-dependent DNA ligase